MFPESNLAQRHPNLHVWPDGLTEWIAFRAEEKGQVLGEEREKQTNRVDKKGQKGEV